MGTEWLHRCSERSAGLGRDPFGRLERECLGMMNIVPVGTHPHTSACQPLMGSNGDWRERAPDRECSFGGDGVSHKNQISSAA